MGDSPLVSVIMPIYNSEKYMRQSIDSVLNQSLNNIELVLIDDGSTDSSLSIAKEIAGHDKRVKVIAQGKNLGPGAAKNLGIVSSNGIYLAFCDADDWVENNMYESLYNNIQSSVADISICGIVQEYTDNNDKVIRIQKSFLDNQIVLGESDSIKKVPELDRARIFSFAVNKLFKRSIIMDNDIRFSGKKFGEDFDFTVRYFEYVNSMIICSQTFYHYMKRDRGSLTEGHIDDYFEIVTDRFKRMKKLLYEKGVYTQETRSQASTVHLKHILAAIVQLNYDNKKSKWIEKVEAIRKMYQDPCVKEALKWARAENRSELICNIIVKMRYYSLELLISKLVMVVQNRRK